MTPSRTTAAACLLTLTTALTWAAGSHDGGHGHGAAGTAAVAPMDDAMHGHASLAGRPGNPAEVTRTVAVEMDDGMRFTPAELTVKAGETIRFFVVNKGKIPHEMVIGADAELDEHAKMMREMPDMKHAEANQITLAPGQRGGLVWQFDQPGGFSFACLIPGHKEAGMVGQVTVRP